MGTRVDARDFYLYRVFREVFCIAGNRDGTIELPLQVVVMWKVLNVRKSCFQMSQCLSVSVAPILPTD